MKKRTEMNRRSFLMGSTAAVAAGGFTRVSAAGSDSANPIVETTAGKIRGLVQEKVAIFRGVPYGASTAGMRRFMPPGKPQPWVDIRDALELGPRAPQQPGGGGIEEWAALDRRVPVGEDCLCLNVWTPAANRRGKRPVMFWLHGGGFVGGSGGHGAYDGTELAAKHDVVLVTVNHRLNVFGYLYLADVGGDKYGASANLGMQDIVAALEWVRDNIAAFGGDPGNVTIWGQSGGASKVANLLAMPSAQGLFHRAIQESGPNLRGVTRETANKGAETFLSRLGLKPGSEGVDQMQQLPMEKLIEAARTPGLPLAPVVDGKILPTNPFDPVAPAISANVPLLIGTNATEMTFFAGTPLDPIDDTELRNRVKQNLHADGAEADRVIEVYKRGTPGISNLDVYLTVSADNFDRLDSITEAERKMALGKAPAYLYYFAWRSPVRDGKLKAMHCMEIPFVFDHVDDCKSVVGSGQDRYALASKMSNAWVAFARTGNPNHKGLPRWAPYTVDERATMIFDNDTRAVNDPRGEERLALIAARKPSRG